MIRPPGFAGAAFGTMDTGDLRTDRKRREQVARDLGIPIAWAFVRQIHSSILVEATRSGMLGEADTIMTQQPGLPIAVATADCVPLIIEAENATAIVHAGWRGAAAGSVVVVLEALIAAGHVPRRAAIGPAIGACCYEVGDEVADLFPGYVSRTEWGSTSIDIPGFLESQLEGLLVWKSNECTYTSSRLYSWRRDQTLQRQVAVAWLPND
ncbi:MAG: polyphenol oxidase family protein [Actinomycetota bacterium]|nr:polyphenol oxidase family protein [Actinomycetota bacterium]